MRRLAWENVSETTAVGAPPPTSLLNDMEEHLKRDPKGNFWDRFAKFHKNMDYGAGDNLERNAFIWIGRTHVFLREYLENIERVLTAMTHFSSYSSLLDKQHVKRMDWRMDRLSDAIEAFVAACTQSSDVRVVRPAW